MIYNTLSSNKQFLSTKTDQQMIDRNNISYPPSPPLSTTYMRSTSPNFKNGSTQSDSWYHENAARGGDSKMLNLEKVIQNYAAHPELLELILSSKVQEDRRRAEEAKLRSKEIDYFIKKQEKEDSILKTQQHRTRVASSSPPPLRYEVVPPSPVENTLPPISSKYYEPRYSVSSASSSESSLLPRLQHQNFSQGLKSHQQASTATNEFPVSHKRNGTSNIDMLLSPVSSPSESKQADFSSSSKDKYEPSKYYQEVGNSKRSYNVACESADNSGQNAEPSVYNKRRRRETQAITAIIETKEFPYNDDYLWKNNGNTVHKKSGFKSIYYKCTNSSKGCPVNKTVTFRDNGEHLIKYRGYHLPECNRIKRIIDVNK